MNQVNVQEEAAQAINGWPTSKKFIALAAAATKANFQCSCGRCRASAVGFFLNHRWLIFTAAALTAITSLYFASRKIINGNH